MSILNKKNVELERENYSNYTPNKVVIVDQYLSEQDKHIRGLCKIMNGRNLLLAPTGSGKTYTILGILKEIAKADTSFKSVFIVPNAIQVTQIKAEYGIGGASGNVDVVKELEKHQIVALTWDKFGQIPKEILGNYCAYLDEVHQTYEDMYRHRKISNLYDNLESCKSQIHITATMGSVPTEQYGFILEYKQNIKTDYEVFLYNRIDENRIFDICRKSKKFILIRDNKDFLDLVKKNVTNKNIDTMDSNKRNLSQAYKHIVEDSTIGNFEGVCSTTMLCAGVNIKDENITDVILVDMKSIPNIVQSSARPRGLDKLRIHIFNEFPKVLDKNGKPTNEFKVSEIRNLNFDVVMELKRLRNHVETDNEANKEYVKHYNVELSPRLMVENSCVFWSNKHRKYVLHEQMAIHNIYRKYYNNADVQSFAELLKEYYNNVNIVYLEEVENEQTKENAKLNKEQREEIEHMLKQHLPYIVGGVDVLSGNWNKRLERYVKECTDLDLISYAENMEQFRNVLNFPKIAKLVNNYSKGVLEENLNPTLAFHLATLSTQAYKRFWARLNNIVYRSEWKKYVEYLPHFHKNHRFYNFLDATFSEVGTNYNQESLDKCAKHFEELYSKDKVKSDEIAKSLHTMFKIDTKQIKKGATVPGLTLIYIENKDLGVVPFDKKTNIYTIEGYIDLDYIVEEEKLDQTSKETLERWISEQINNITVKDFVEDTDNKMNVEQIKLELEG